MDWKNRIIGHDEVDPKTLKANPLNWRLHPSNQRKALKTTLDEIGWIGSVKVNKNNGVIVDGHLRVEMAMEQEIETIPVEWVDLDENEERFALAAYDSITEMADRDDGKFDELLSSMIDESRSKIESMSGKEEDFDLSQFDDFEPNEQQNESMKKITLFVSKDEYKNVLEEIKPILEAFKTCRAITK